MMEAQSERERYVGNPLRLLRCAVELGKFAAQRVDDNLFDFPPYTPENYPHNWQVETPCASEDDLI